MFRLHKKIHEREWTGKPAKIMDVSYVIIYNPYMRCTKAKIEECYFQIDQINSSMLNCKAYTNELEAENDFLQNHKEKIQATQQESKENGISYGLYYYTKQLKNYPESGFDKDIDLKPADFQNNAYLIATIKGKPEEVTQMLKYGHVDSNFGKKILSVRDNSKTTFLVNPNAVLVEHKAVKEEEKPSLSKRSP